MTPDDKAGVGVRNGQKIDDVISEWPHNDIPEFLWETFDHIEDATSANAEREGYTDDPLSSEQAIDEETSCNFIPIKSSGVLDVNGASVSAEDISNQMRHKLQIDNLLVFRKRTQ